MSGDKNSKTICCTSCPSGKILQVGGMGTSVKWNIEQISCLSLKCLGDRVV